MTIGTFDLPDGWKRRRLSDICDVILGQSPPSSTYRKSPEGLPFFQGKADFGKVSPVPTTWCVEPKKIAKRGDILISVRAPVGPTNIAESRCCIGRGLAALRCRSSSHRDFLIAFLKLYESELSKMGSGSTFNGITGKQIRNLSIPLPHMAEQRRIVSILNKQVSIIEKARTAAERRVTAAGNLRAAFMRNAFDSENSKKWPERAIGEICKISAKQVNPELDKYKDLPYVNGENIASGKGHILFLKSAGDLRMRSGKYLFAPGDVLYSKLRPYLRKVTTVDFRGLCSADMYPLTPVQCLVHQDYLKYILLSKPFSEYAESESQRTRMPKLNRAQLLRWKQRIPSLEEQVRIMEQLNEQMEHSGIIEDMAQASLDDIELLPGSVLRLAFSGEL